MQEYNSAKSAVEAAARAVGVEVPIQSERVDEYPIFVRVTAFMDDGEEVTVWEDRQQNLFRKNRTRRQNSMKEITSALTTLLKQAA
mmetsp:Transcript_46311/g.144875  ORF Transcript_46311/g.144875 Transcript_46311/m.144875 type:complete len:86 (+) Transcript_46311:185-442(+)